MAVQLLLHKGEPRGGSQAVVSEQRPCTPSVIAVLLNRPQLRWEHEDPQRVDL